MDVESLFVFLGVCIFFLTVIWVIVNHPIMFLKVYGRRHRLCGALLLLWILFGFVQLYYNLYSFISPFLYDVSLEFLATITTLTAAFDFQKAHSHIVNKASGTLEKEATVTYSEMIEHSFYQLLNLLQIVFIHSLPIIQSQSLPIRLLIAFLFSSLWFLRGSFPVNKFSDNYNKGQDVFSIISILYRTKKYQYMFYKHFLLHSLTISLAASSSSTSLSLLQVGSHSFVIFRLYWLCLNTSYVMEFFLQTLVKKNYMSQSVLISLQLLLMFVSTIVAVEVLYGYCNGWLGMLSLGLNLINRKREMMNVGIVILAAYFLYSSSEQQ